jgi:protein-S-isoprenylcysteine O-methyltransferase Ste14
VDEAPKTSRSTSEVVDAVPSEVTDSEALGDKLRQIWGKVEALPEKIVDKIASFDTEKFSRETAAFWKKVLDNTLAGEWFNRGETYVVVQLALILLILRDPGALDPLFGLLLGPVPLFLGIYVIVQSIRELGAQNFVPWIKPPASASLKTDGLYGLMRHPIYSGIILSSFGFASVSHSPERLVLTLVLFYFFTRKAAEEEKYLTERFGKEYEEYAARVKGFIPKVY